MNKQQQERIKNHVCSSFCWKRCNYAQDVRDGMPPTILKQPKMTKGRGGFRVGQKVRVRGQRQFARIERFYNDIEGGLVLDRMIKGFYSWNVQDLVRVKKAK